MRDAYGSIAHAEAVLKTTESPVHNKGLSADKSLGFKTKATGAVIDKKDAEAAAASEISPEGTKDALMQIRGAGDAPPKGFSDTSSIKGPAQGAPIGATVHAIASENAGAYARVHDEA